MCLLRWGIFAVPRRIQVVRMCKVKCNSAVIGNPCAIMLRVRMSYRVNNNHFNNVILKFPKHIIVVIAIKFIINFN